MTRLDTARAVAALRAAWLAHPGVPAHAAPQAQGSGGDPYVFCAHTPASR